jgi:hypothetical protein
MIDRSLEVHLVVLRSKPEPSGKALIGDDAIGWRNLRSRRERHSEQLRWRPGSSRESSIVPPDGLRGRW